jgi:hypothetical protein
MSGLSHSLSHLPTDIVHVNPPQGAGVFVPEIDINPALDTLLEAPGLTDVNFADLRRLARQIAEDRVAFAALSIRTMFSVALAPAEHPRAGQAGNGQGCDRGRTFPAPANQLRAHNRQRDIPTLTSDTEVPMSVSQLEREPSWTKYELEAIKSLSEVEELTSLDRDTLVRVYPEYLVKLSPKRRGMKFRNVLKIMNGDAAAA